MGMAASQARFLGLTGRKSNTEYQGQQVNQQRSSLANESAGLFNQMTALKVPTPPSSINYYSSRYQFSDTLGDNTFSLKKIGSVDSNNNANVSIEYDVKEIGASERKVTYKTVSKNATTGVYTVNTHNGTADANFTLSPVESGKFTKEIEAIKKSREESGYYNGKDKSSETFYTYTLNGVSQIISSLDLETGNNKTIPTFVSKETVTKATYDAVATFSKDDTTGRYTSVTFAAGNEKIPAELEAFISSGKTIELSIGKIEDKDGYEAAMKDYEFQKMMYDRQIDDLNNRTEKIQQQDKVLELKLRQLDTEQKAIQTEMEAVQKVIQKNVETTFKTFG